VSEDTATGGCRCGATRYALAPGTRVTVYACHCLDCQSWSGSAFSENARLPADALAVEGPTVAYAHGTPSGGVATHTLCAVCRTRICNTHSALPGVVVLRAGTLDASDRLAPAAHLWTRRRQPWLTLPDGIPAWEEGAAVADFAAALRTG
jgi:hypothetical protein